MSKEYVSHAVPTEISATSRCAICIRDTHTGKDNYYTIEATEKRAITDVNGIDMDLEYKMLFDEINDVVDNQMADIVKAVKERK